MLVLILEFECVCSCLFCFYTYLGSQIVYRCSTVNTDRNRAVFRLLVDYSLAIYFVHAVKKLE